MFRLNEIAALRQMGISITEISSTAAAGGAALGTETVTDRLFRLARPPVRVVSVLRRGVRPRHEMAMDTGSPSMARH